MYTENSILYSELVPLTRDVNKLQTLERYGENPDDKKLSVEHWKVLGTFEF